MSQDAFGNFVNNIGSTAVEFAPADGPGGGSQQVYEGHGAPTITPSKTDNPALYRDLDTGAQYAWNTETQAWE